MKFFSSVLLQRAIPFLLIPIAARNLSPTDFGSSIAITTYAMVLAPLLTLGLNATIVKQGSMEIEKPSIWKQHLIVQLVWSTLVCTGLLIVGLLLSKIGNYFKPILVMSLVMAFSNGLVTTLQTLTLAIKRNGNLLFSAFFGGSASIIGAIFLSKFFGLFGYLLSLILSNFLIIIILLPKQSLMMADIKRENIRPLLSKSLPFMVHSLASTGMTYTDRFFLSFRLKATALAGYYVSVTIGGIPGLILEVIHAYWSAHFVNHFGNNFEGKRILGLMQGQLLKIGRMISIASFSSYVFLVRLIAPHQIVNKYVFFIIAISYIPRSFYFCGYSFALVRNKTTDVSKATGIGMLAMIVLCLILIPEFGGLGGAVATSLSFFTQGVVMWKLSLRDVIQHPIIICLRELAVISISFAVINVLNLNLPIALVISSCCIGLVIRSTKKLMKISNE